MPPRPRVTASYAPPVSGLPVRQASILYTAFFRFHLTADTLALSLTVLLTGARRGLSPPSVVTYRSHIWEGLRTPPKSSFFEKPGP